VSTELERKVKASWLANQLNLPLIGADVDIERVRPGSRLTDASLTFSRTPVQAAVEGSIVVIGPEEAAAEHITVLVSENPRLHFAVSLQILDQQIGFQKAMADPIIHPSVQIGAHTVIGRNVNIGENTVIEHHVVMTDGVVIGRNCRIKSGTVIGEDGFGFEREESGNPYRIKHLGSVRIGDDVEIGSLCTVCKGTLDDTVIGNHAKIDDHVHVSHNCQIKEGAIITAGTVLGGGTIVGRNAWMGLNATTMQKVKIGDNAFVGMGAVVIQDVNAGEKVFGNPARKISR
jgi:UDP-3-O-[3-hydroxymyristoyl] glucosamine N-acyltransferase